jgi:predicted PurR-regulated permease PerM
MPKTQDPSLEEFKGKTYFVLKVVLITAIVLFLISLASNIFLLGFAAVLLALFFRGLAELIERYTRLPSWASLTVSILAIFLITGSVIAISAPSISEQAEELSRQLPQSVQRVSDYIREREWGGRLLDEAGGRLSFQNLSVAGREILSRAGNFASAVGNAVVNLLVIVLAAVYLTIAPREYKDDVVRLFPPSRRQKAEAVLRRLAVTLQWWIAGRLFSMAVIGIMTLIGLLILDVPLALLLAFVAALLNFIPNLGPILSAIPAVLICFSQSPEKALYVIILYAAIQLIESYFLTPWVEKRTVAIRPAFLLIVQIFFGIFFGFFGLVLSSAIVAVAIVLIKALYIEPMENQGAKA